MTDGRGLARDPSGRDATPELRVSDRDRDQVVEILQVAAGDGRLTAVELDERLDAALSARTTGDLARLTADLPLDGMPPQAKDLVRIDQRFGDVTRSGRWLVPRRMEIRLMFCDAKLDFTDALITHNTLHIDVDLRIGGNLLLVTRPGIVVDTDDLTRSSGDIKIRPASGPGTPVVLRVQLAGQSPEATLSLGPRGGRSRSSCAAGHRDRPLSVWSARRRSRRAARTGRTNCGASRCRLTWLTVASCLLIPGIRTLRSARYSLMSADDASPDGSPAVPAARVRAFQADRSFAPGQRRLQQGRTGRRLAPRPRRVASHLAVVATPVGAMARRGAGSGGRPRRTHARGKVAGRTVFVNLAIISPAASGASLPRAYVRGDTLLTALLAMSGGPIRRADR